MREIADEVGATLMVDMAHFAGLVAGKVFTGDFDPVPHAHLVTTTTHKSLRGPRGGMVLCQPEFADAVDRGCPMVLGGPLGHVMAAKAVALAEARQPSFQTTPRRSPTTPSRSPTACCSRGARLVTGGTDNHLVLHRRLARSASPAARPSRRCSTPASSPTATPIPRDPNGAWYTSGVRIGTPALTTRGFGAAEFDRVAELIVDVLKSTTPATASDRAARQGEVHPRRRRRRRPPSRRRLSCWTPTRCTLASRCRVPRPDRREPHGTDHGYDNCDDHLRCLRDQHGAA